jgi:hypothetical protein
MGADNSECSSLQLVTIIQSFSTMWSGLVTAFINELQINETSLESQLRYKNWRVTSDAGSHYANRIVKTSRQEKRVAQNIKYVCECGSRCNQTDASVKLITWFCQKWSSHSYTFENEKYKFLCAVFYHEEHFILTTTAPLSEMWLLTGGFSPVAWTFKTIQNDHKIAKDIYLLFYSQCA